MNTVEYEELGKLLIEHDPMDVDVGDVDRSSDALREVLAAYFAGREFTRSVLGIDIYRYSGYENERQRVIPTLLRFNYDLAAKMCETRERFLFPDGFPRDHFISTGDGGFQIADTPLHCLVFAAYFQLAITNYNSYLLWPRLRQFVGPLSLRYAITTDLIFKQDTNFFGAAIINNARILSRDKLNRLLVDGASIGWFERHMGNIESLLGITQSELAALPLFKGRQAKDMGQSLIFGGDDSHAWRSIHSLHLQKIGLISAKETTLDVFNLQMQIGLNWTAPRDGAVPRNMIVTLGNLNTTGLSS